MNRPLTHFAISLKHICVADICLVILVFLTEISAPEWLMEYTNINKQASCSIGYHSEDKKKTQLSQ